MKISEYLPMLKGIQKVSEQTRSILKITRGHNSNETEGRVTILFFCASADDASYLYNILQKKIS